MASPREIDTRGLAERIEAFAGYADARATARDLGVEAYLVGGAVRDALLGATRAELDLVVDGDHLAFAFRLGDDVREHDRFLTATVRTAEGPIDVARARRESYAHPGALPTVEPAPLREDLGRRDFSVNAIAVALADPGTPIDPYEGIADLRASVLRALHQGSLADDPTRALRAARYCARLGLEPDPATLMQIERARLDTVSADRVDAELAKLAREPDPRGGFELLDRWGLLELSDRRAEAIDSLVALLGREPWSGAVAREAAVIAAARGEWGDGPALAKLSPASPSVAVAHAAGHGATELAIARVLGAEWLDPYMREWRHVRPRITGADLLAAGVPQGPGVGAGLRAALNARLDGMAADQQTELEVALAAARGAAGERD